MGPDESNIGVWFWVALLVGVNLVWISMDIWLYKNGHEMLTDEFREGLHNRVLGPLLVFLLTGTVAAFIWHMFFTSPRTGVH